MRRDRTRREDNALHRVATFFVMMTAVLLWGYLIGAYFQLQTDTSSPKAADIKIHLPLNQPTEEADSGPKANVSDRGLEQPAWDTLRDLVDEHPRFLPRNRSFKSRLEYDPEFVRENSF